MTAMLKRTLMGAVTKSKTSDGAEGDEQEKEKAIMYANIWYRLAYASNRLRYGMRCENRAG